MCMADNAHFSWETPGMAASALQEATAAYEAIGLGMLSRCGIYGTLRAWWQALARGALMLPCMLLNAFAIFLIAKGPRTT